MKRYIALGVVIAAIAISAFIALVSPQIYDNSGPFTLNLNQDSIIEVPGHPKASFASLDPFILRQGNKIIIGMPPASAPEFQATEEDFGGRWEVLSAEGTIAVRLSEGNGLTVFLPDSTKMVIALVIFMASAILFVLGANIIYSFD